MAPLSDEGYLVPSFYMGNDLCLGHIRPITGGAELKFICPPIRCDNLSGEPELIAGQLPHWLSVASYKSGFQPQGLAQGMDIIRLHQPQPIRVGVAIDGKLLPGCLEPPYAMSRLRQTQTPIAPIVLHGYIPFIVKDYATIWSQKSQVAILRTFEDIDLQFLCVGSH